jgi:stage II sporulation protein D
VRKHREFKYSNSATRWYKAYLSLFLSLLIFFFFPANTSAQKVNISLFHTEKLEAFMFTSLSGEYEIRSNEKAIESIIKNEIIHISISENEITVKAIGTDFGSFARIEIVGLSRVNSFRIKPILPSIDSRSYEGNLHITVEEGHLKVINRVALESYIAGVVETEGGPNSPLEYYKSQALICRTYALGHINRHEKEGFQLCDGVHCQAYHGMSMNNHDVEIATEETAGLVIVDAKGNLITAAYHSNCGGETENSENVWTIPLPYLKSIEEDYCKQGPHSKWESTIPIADWKEYLKKNGFKNIDGLGPDDFAYKQHGRQYNYVLNEDSMRLRKIRADWKFKSTYFWIYPVDDVLYFKGIGYGHGVGLCQEGAMEMARQGFSYQQIIHHYYKDTKIINY